MAFISGNCSTVQDLTEAERDLTEAERESNDQCQSIQPEVQGQHQHVERSLSGVGDDQTLGVISLGQTMRELHANRLTRECIQQDSSVLNQCERDHQCLGIQPGDQGQHHHVEQGEEHQHLTDHKALRGGAPDGSTCCESICPLHSNTLCETCDHHVCFVHSIDADNYVVCGHCDETEALSESIPPEEELREDDGLSETNNNEEEMRKCDNCDMECKYLIPHLKKKNSAGCREFYFKKYLKEFSPNVSDNLKILGRILGNHRKIEQQRLRRLNKDYREKMNSDQHDARIRKRVDPNNMTTDYHAAVEAILSRYCEACANYLSPKDVETVPRESCLYREDGPVFVCKYCKTMEKDLERWMTLGVNDDELEKEYQIWAKDNFSLAKKLSSLQKAITRNEHPNNVGVLIFDKNLRRYYVVFPSLKSDCDEIRIEESLECCDNNDPMVLLPETFLEDVIIETVSKEEYDLASRSNQIDFVNLMSLLFNDRLNQMNYAKRSRISRNAEIRKGLISENKLQLMEANSMKGALGNIRGTTDYVTKHRNETKFKQWQNGKTNIRFSYAVFNGFQSIHTDSIMAKCILQTKGHHFASMQKEDDENKSAKEYRLKCCVECDPFECELQDDHPTALEKVRSSPQDVDPLSVCRFLSEKISLFIKRCVEPIAKDYDLFLLFDRPSGPDVAVGLPADSGFAPDSGFSLSGHIWIDKLTVNNTADAQLPTGEDLIPEVLRKDNLTKLLGDGFGGAEVIQKFADWPDQLYTCENEDITNITAQRFDADEVSSLREMSIFEAIFSSGRNLKMAWTTQSVTLIDTSDPRKVYSISIF